MSPGELDVYIKDASQSIPLSFDVPTEAPFQNTPHSSTFDNNKYILVNEDLP